jgi:malonate-semialdehyde dehydrogenase (acetylating)/methylmalonate-semialdehyde dehydrogenase
VTATAAPPTTDVQTIAMVDASRYGNASAIVTESGGAARAYRYGVAAGMVGDDVDGDLHADGRDAVEFYTRKKVVTSRWAA